jgi:DNA-binding LacI/PurR family transcriptional regulator
MITRLIAPPSSCPNLPIIMPASRPKAVRLLDVARAAGVSRVAAAHVLNGAGSASVRVSPATRRRVESIARELNYRPNRAAQQLRGMPSGLIGVIFDSQWPTNLQRLSMLEQAGIAHGLRFMVGQVHGDPRLAARYLDDFADRDVQGILCIVDLKTCFLDELQPLFQGRQNVIFHGRPLHDDGLCVRVDTEDGIRQSVSHLVERGRRRIGLLLSESTDEFMTLRRRGYTAEFAARGLNAEPNLIWSAETESGLPDAKALDRAIDTLIAQEHADAVIAADDVWAVRLIQRLKARSYRVPTDVAVVGYDNLDMATVIEPALTTVDQDHAAYAKAVIKMLGQLIEQGSVEPEARTAVIKPRLIIRESTASETR